MVERLYFTDDDTSNALIAQEPFALLIGFVLDQQVTVQKAFAGPLAIRERVGTLDPAALAATDLEPVFRQVPAVHRYPGEHGQAGLGARRPRRRALRRRRGPGVDRGRVHRGPQGADRGPARASAR